MIITKKNIINGFRTIHKQAMATRQYALALHALECQARIMGMFQHQRLPPITRFQDMDQYQLQSFIETLEKNEFGFIDEPNKKKSKKDTPTQKENSENSNEKLH
ncbi:MAG: hypothetical protein FJX71_02990 [Alphaproteobacteria bacterium]|nr:hypothetical protein [Alphaproteobacteria bacterium]